MARLLLVDDNHQLLDLYKTLLEHAGHEVMAAENCESAAGYLEQAAPEIMVMDLRVPQLKDGLGLLRLVKDHAANCVRPPRIVVMSGWVGDLEDAPERAQVDRVLSKPVRIETLVEVIAELAAQPRVQIGAPARPL